MTRAELETVELVTLVERVRDHALERYNDGGWDVIVECWEDQQIADRIRAAGACTVPEAIAAFAPLVDVWADRQADALNSAF